MQDINRNMTGRNTRREMEDAGRTRVNMEARCADIVRETLGRRDQEEKEEEGRGGKEEWK